MTTLTTSPLRQKNALNQDSLPGVLIPYTLKQFANQRVIMTTSFGMEGCVLIDMYSKAMPEFPAWRNRRMQVVYLDTHFFFPETYALRDQMIERYPNMHFYNGGTDLTPEDQERIHGPELWKNNPTLCCKLRKVDPMYPIMEGADVWLTGLQRSQSATRSGLQAIEWDFKYGVLKVSPLANWTREDTLGYIKKHDVPYNTLHEQGYPTIGCTHCTTPVPGVSIGEYTRAGRWADSKIDDCGLHGSSGI